MNEASKYLLIKAKGGLGNRILSAISGLIYADLSNRIPVIDWRDGSYAQEGVNSYPKLFDTPLDTDISELEHIDDVAPRIWRGHLHEAPTHMIARNDPKRHSDPFIYRKYCVNLKNLQEPARVVVYWSYLPKTKRLRSAMRANGMLDNVTEEQVTQDYLERYFCPNERVRQQVATLISGIPRPIIGVHVRYTDRKISLNKIEREIARAKSVNKDAAIFLATDNEFVQSSIQNIFGDVYTIKKWFPPENEMMHQNNSNINRLFEAENALIDMWTLASCDKLIYSKRSTFSYTSKLIGDISGKNEINVDRFNAKVVFKGLLQEII